jgi:hypothetical protein
LLEDWNRVGPCFFFSYLYFQHYWNYDCFVCCPFCFNMFCTYFGKVYALFELLGLIKNWYLKFIYLKFIWIKINKCHFNAVKHSTNWHKTVFPHKTMSTLWIEPQTSCLLGNHSTNYAIADVATTCTLN